MTILVIDNHSKSIKDLEKVLQKFRAPYLVFDQKALFNSFHGVRDVSGIILSGGGPSLEKKIDLSSIRGNVASVLNFAVPVLGICEGHQILGEIFGGNVLKKNKKIEDNIKINLKKRTAIFHGLPEEIIAHESHVRYVRDVPFVMDVAASSSEDEVEALFHKNKPIFSVQFHPEKSGEHGEKIIQNFLDICREKKPKV